MTDVESGGASPFTKATEDRGARKFLALTWNSSYRASGSAEFLSLLPPSSDSLLVERSGARGNCQIFPTTFRGHFNQVQGLNAGTSFRGNLSLLKGERAAIGDRHFFFGNRRSYDGRQGTARSRKGLLGRLPSRQAGRLFHPAVFHPEHPSRFIFIRPLLGHFGVDIAHGGFGS